MQLQDQKNLTHRESSLRVEQLELFQGAKYEDEWKNLIFNKIPETEVI